MVVVRVRGADRTVVGIAGERVVGGAVVTAAAGAVLLVPELGRVGATGVVVPLRLLGARRAEIAARSAAKVRWASLETRQ